MFAYLEILRPVNCVMAAVAVYIGAIVAGLGYMPAIAFLIPLLYAMSATLLICGAGMVINDFFDIDIDKINAPERPIPSGRIQKKSALVYSGIIFAVGVSLSYLVNIYTLYVAVFASALLILYAWKLKKMVLIGNISVSLLVALTFVFGGLVAGNYMPTLMLALLAFLANTGREIFKGIVDVLGDRQLEAETVAVKYGVVRAKMIATLFVIFAIILSFLPFFLNMFGIIYMFFVVIADILFMIVIVAPVKLAPKVCKFAMFVALLAFLVGGIV